VAFAVAIIALMQTTSIALLPALPEVFDVSIASVSWVATATLITGAAVNPIVGRMGDMYGKRRLLLVCLGATLLGSVLGMVADSLLVVIAARAVQGLGSGVVPLAYAIVRDELPIRHVGRAVSVVTAAGAALGAGAGPVVMGSVVTTHGWQAVFAVTAVLSAAALALVAVSTRGASTRFPARFDWPGAVVLTAALVILLLGVTNGAGWGWTSSRVLGLVAVAIALTVWWVRYELTRHEPLVDLAVSATGQVLLAHLGGFMVGFATFAQYIATFTLISMPADTGHGLGRTFAVAGLVQLPGVAVLALSVLLATRISATRGSHALLSFGALLIVAGFALSIVRHDSLGEIVLSVAIVNAGLGSGFCALPLLIIENVPLGQTAAVNAVNALTRVVGSVLSSAIVTSVMATGAVLVAGVERPAEWTFVAAYALGAIPAGVVGVLAWRWRRQPLATACL
jgi:MFS family permease